MPSFRDVIDTIQNGEDINAAITNRPILQLLDNTKNLRDSISDLEIPSATVITDVAVESGAAVGQPVYWNSGNSRYERALDDGTDKAKVVGLIWQKSSATLCHVVTYGSVSVDLATAVGGSVTYSRYWLSTSVAGRLTSSQPTSSGILVCLADATGRIFVGPQLYTTPPDLTAGRSIDAQNGTNYTLASSDIGKLITLSNAANITLRVPLNANTALPVSAEIDLFNLGAGGTVVITPDANVTLHSVNGSLNLGQNCGASLKKIGTDEWILAGNLS